MTATPGPFITGVGVITALGRGLAATREALAAGRSAIAPVTEPGPRKHASPAARIGPFTTEPEMARSKARRLDLGSQYAIVAAHQCLLDAGYPLAGREERTGILLGTGSAGAGPLTEFERQMAAESPESASPFLFPNTVANAPASQTALELKLKGPNVTVIQKDPAALNAMLYARMMLADGRADALLVGAADEWNLLYHEGYERILATRSAGRCGHALGEGAGLVLVESAASVAARGARPYARLAGVGYRGSPVSPHRRRGKPEEFVEAMRGALGAEAPRVGLVHLSANGTTWMDDAEQAALRALFGDSPPRQVNVKEQIGENPFAGGVQLALAAVALREEPSLGAVLVNGFGAGGNFASVLLTAAAPA